MAAPPDLKQRIAFQRIEAADVDLLRELGPVLEKHAPTFVAAFYRHLLSFAPTRALLRDPAVKDRLMLAQREYLVSLADPHFDADYLERRSRIGRTHERVGLAPRWYLGAYTLYFTLLAPIVFELYPRDPDKAMRTIAALQKILMLDAQIALDTYIESHERDLTYLTRELEKEGRKLGRAFERQRVELASTLERARTAEELASIATLVTGLAHEIGTPMGVIQGHAKLLERAVSGDDALWRLRTIQDQIGRISRIIQTLLNIARPSRTKRQPVVLEALIDTTLSFVREKLRRRNIELATEYAPVPSVVGDPERLQQLLLNLFLNAADAMPEGGVLRVSLAGGKKGSVSVSVSDTGAGIPEADLEHVFEPFFTTKAAGEGNGLGLMVAKGIVGDHGGSIDVRSRVGEGTEFRIALPAWKQPGVRASA